MGGYVSGIEKEMVFPQILAAGVGPTVAAELFSACERGFVAAMNEKDKAHGEQD